MPSRFQIKTYTDNTYHHLFNRGVEKRPIFLEDKDYAVLLSYLKTYLSPKNKNALSVQATNSSVSWRERDQALRLLRMNNFYGTILLLSYCLMPNHFHMVVWQKHGPGIDEFMNSLWTRYTMYFNHKYHRVGTLFQSVYKAVVVSSDEQLLHLTRYIHQNPIAHRKLRTLDSKGEALRSYVWSSYKEYLGLRQAEWINTNTVLSRWSINKEYEYEKFVLETDAVDSAKLIAPLMI